MAHERRTGYYCRHGDIIIRSFVLMGAYFIFMRQSAQLGTLTLAANAVLMHFLFFAEYFLGGISSAAQQLVGRAIGARDKAALLRTVRLTAGWGFAIARFASILAFTLGDYFVYAITTAADVHAEAAVYFP